MAAGKRQLMDAALRLLAHQQDVDTLSLRELAREAGLNHNTFYRHFRDLQDLQTALMHDFTQRLREGTRQARANVGSHPSVTHRVVGWLFDFALQHPAHFKAAQMTRQGPPGAARDLLESHLDEVRRDMQTQLMQKGMLPSLSAADLETALAIIIEHTFTLCIRCIEAPLQREALLVRAEQGFTWVLSGAALTAGN